MNKICVTYSHHKLGDLIWQLPYIEALSNYHNLPVDLIVRKKTQAKIILLDSNYIKNIFYNDFRKGIWYWMDVFKLVNIFYKNNYNYVYMLDKVNKPAIAAKILSIKNIIGPGLGKQKNWITSKKILSNDDLKLNYSEQSLKFLKINSIPVKNKIPSLDVNINRFKKNNHDIFRNGKKISFGVDSFEDFKMWYEEDFIELANLLYKKKFFDFIYLICGPEKSYIAQKIKKISKENYFIDCSHKDLGGVIYAIKNSNFFIGNNSGPLNLSAALNVKSFGLIANDPVSELKYSKIIPITPVDYVDNIWNRDRKGMKKLTVEKVFNDVSKHLDNQQGKYLILYFYPTNDTPGCAIETNDFNKLLPKFKKLNCDIFGITKDDLKSHHKFKIKFDLLSDVELNILKKYKVWAKKKFMGREFMGIVRTTFLIDPNGKIVKIWDNVKVKDHAKEVFDTLKNSIN